MSSLTYQSLSKHPRCFQNLTGLSLQEFAGMREKVRPAYLIWEGKKKGSGYNGPQKLDRKMVLSGI